MTIKISASQSNADDGADLAERSPQSAMLRGAAHRCPACGKGALYDSYLKITDQCSSCQQPLHHHRADDAPPYFTIFIVGHIILAGVLAVEQSYAPPYWLHIAIWIPLTFVLSLTVLPRIKGILVGLQWALRMHGFGRRNDQRQLDDHESGST